MNQLLPLLLLMCFFSYSFANAYNRRWTTTATATAPKCQCVADTGRANIRAVYCSTDFFVLNVHFAYMYVRFILFSWKRRKKNLQLISQMRRICLGFVTFFLCLNKICHEFIVKFALIAKTWRFFFRKNLGEKNDYLRFNGSPCHRYNVRENKKKQHFFICKSEWHSHITRAVVRSYLLIHFGETCSQTAIVMFWHVFSLGCFPLAIDSFHLVCFFCSCLLVFFLCMLLEFKCKAVIHWAVC